MCDEMLGVLVLTGVGIGAGAATANDAAHSATIEMCHFMMVLINSAVSEY